jgi:hypothetical protein
MGGSLISFLPQMNADVRRCSQISTLWSDLLCCLLGPSCNARADTWTSRGSADYLSRFICLDLRPSAFISGDESTDEFTEDGILYARDILPQIGRLAIDVFGKKMSEIDRSKDCRIIVRPASRSI